ncbi:hypothetical protein JCM10213_005989 [Rhodosporidiobolus nylandii]
MNVLPSNELGYSDLSALWPSGEILLVSYTPGNLDLTIRIPTTFLAGSGCGTHGFVEHIAQILVEEPGSLRRKTDPETELEEDTEPDTAVYVFIPAEKGTSFTETRGPEGKRSRYRKVDDFDSDRYSSVSHSSQCYEPHEQHFRELVTARDGWCHFTQSAGDDCVAAHLVPQSRGDVYDQLGFRHPYRADCGLLLNPSLHGGYDRYRWSLYHKDGVYRFISLEGKKPEFAQHHGKTVTAPFLPSHEPPHSSFWRGQDPPHPALCDWHFRQAVMKNIRGYSVRMAINAQ